MRFSRNFGKEAAIFAGLAQARGDCAAVMDCDLQHPPEKLEEMYRLWQQGYEVIEGVKVSRGKESPLHAFAAHRFYDILSRVTGVDMSRASDFKLLDRKAVDTLVALREKNMVRQGQVMPAYYNERADACALDRCMTRCKELFHWEEKYPVRDLGGGKIRAAGVAMASWIGFKTTQVEFEVQPRVAGESKWSVMSLVRYAVTNIAAFSTAPLQIVTLLGSVVFLASVVLGLHSLWQKFTGQALEGFTTVIILILFIGSILMICLGIIGYYIAKIYEEIKDRPRYILADQCGGNDESASGKAV